MAKVAHLLKDIIPHHYRLSLDVDAEQFRFTAQEELKFKLVRPSRQLFFHAFELQVTQAELGGQAASGIKIDAANQMIIFSFNEEIAAGNHTLKLEFSGEISESLHGFYRSSYQAEGQEKWLLTTQFEAVHAREAFVCIDEPSAKAVFDLSLTVPDHLVALSNTEVAEEAPAGEGRKQVTFAATPKMSTYLVAYVIGELEHLEQTTPEGVMVRVFATPGHTSQLAFALETGVRTLSFYNDYFGVPYPLTKLDMVAIPDFASGAMENWGLVTYREVALMLDPVKSSLSNKQRVAEVITHELAHQWFGNLVTMAWWDDLWLNEGFASWMEVYAKDKLFPDWQVWTEYVSVSMSYAMELDGLANTHAIQVEVDDPQHLDEIFDAISYDKGSNIINMLHHYLGADNFRKGMRTYLERHEYGNTTTHDLWLALSDASGEPVDEVMSAWTGRPGYPIVSFDNGQMAQRRFYSSPREAAKAELEANAPWPVPFNVALPDGQETKTALIATPAHELASEIVESDWFKPNPGQTGFYRTLYTEGMIEALAAPMHSGRLDATDRFGIVNDVFAAAEAGETDSVTALKLVQALREEQDYVVWGGVTGGLGSLAAIVEDEPLREALDEFGGWLVQPNLARLGWEAAEGETTFDTLMRPIVLQQAARFDDATVVEEAKRHFKAYLEGAAIDPDLRPAILYAVVRHGGAEEFEAILERYRRESSPQAKMSLLSALGRFHNPELIDRFLKLGLSDDVRPQDIYIVIAWGFRNRYGRQQTWDWMRANWDEFVTRYAGGGHMLERFPLYAAWGFATHEKAAEIRDFFESHALPSTKRPTAQAFEAVELKADWYDRDKHKIEAFIHTWKASQK